MSNTQVFESDIEGNAYGRPAGKSDDELTRVGPGSPCGEYLRRFWHPIALASTATTTPQRVRILGENLILFRDGKGRLGLLTERCAHRGTSLYYGRVDDGGIACCYHGWKFDVRGRCIDQPCESDGGAKTKSRLFQPWYPTQERYGLVFAYMGPPAKKPILPRLDILENLNENEKIHPTGPTGFGFGADDTIRAMPCNWLQQYENTMDPFHLTILHSRHSGVQFSPDLVNMPEVKFEWTDLGVKYIATIPMSNGKRINRVSPAILPNMRCPGSVHLKPGPSNTITWSVPEDDTSHLVFQAARVPLSFESTANLFRTTRPVRSSDKDSDKTPTDPKLWSELTEAQKQRYPGDWEAQESQGPITLHSEEHLGASDQGVVMLRRLLREQIRLVQEGGDPIGTAFDESKAFFRVGGGNHYVGEPEPVIGKA